MKIRISNKNNRFILKKMPVKQLCRQILQAELSDPDCELDITVVSNEEITLLNEQYLRHQGPTDVLSFPQINDGQDLAENHQLGDIVISLDMAREQSERFNNSINQEFGLYIIHGILHLLGYDDIEESKKMIMETKQTFWFNMLLSKDDMIFVSPKQR